MMYRIYAEIVRRNVKIGDKIKEFRIDRNLTQEELAFKANINDKYYWRIEHNKSCPTINVLLKICKALDINILSLLAYDTASSNSKDFISPKISELFFKCFLSGFTIHFNTDVIYANCESSVWYNGYIGSIHFDEFELSLYAEGNIKGELYKDYILLEEFNSADISNRIRRYVSTDNELNRLIVYTYYDEEILNLKKGNALFISENNWLSVTIRNLSTKRIIESDIILDSDNIIDALGNVDILLEYIFPEDIPDGD